LATLKYSKGATKLLELAYGYTQNGGNNGQITSITDSTGTQEAGRSATYDYDAWARLKEAETTGSTTYPKWHYIYDYDRFGNLKGKLLQGDSVGSHPSLSVAISTATNRITTSGFAYDAAGNMTNDAQYIYTFDAENRIKQKSAGTAATYYYDGAGLRVKKVSGGTTTRYIFSGTRVIAEYVNGAAVGSPTREYVYAGSQLVATLNSTGTPTYHHPDHLSARINSNGSGSLVGQQGNYPFGQAWYSSSTTTKWRFTSYERDAESNLDYAIFRYDSNRLGRFMSPDPLAGSIRNPQSLNRYSYVNNDPVNLIDPLGLYCIGIMWIDREGTIKYIPLWCSDGGYGGGGGGGGNGPDPMTPPDDGSDVAGGGLGPLEQGPEDITDNQDILDAMYCLWKAASYGWSDRERSMWIAAENGNLSTIRWPWSAESGRETWRGPRPPGSVAIAHTHPNALSPKPSTTGGNTDRGDQGTADTQALPVYVVTRDAIWKAVPKQEEPSQVTGRDWWKDSREREKKGELKCP